MPLGWRMGYSTAVLFTVAALTSPLMAAEKSETSSLNPPNTISGSCAVVLQTHDGFLAVRGGPGAQHREVMRIFPGQIVVSQAGQDLAGSWRRISATLDGIGQPERRIEGWVHTSFLTGVNC